MSAVAQIISRIPGLDDYNDQVKQNAALTGQNIQHGAQFMTLQGAMQEQAAKRAEIERQAAYRAKFAAAPDDETRAKLAAESVGAQGYLTYAQKLAHDRATAAQAAATQAMRMGQFDQNMQLRWSNAKDAREKALVEAQWKQGRLALETANAQVGANNSKYNTGSNVDIPSTPQLTMPGAQAQPTGGNVTGPTFFGPATPDQQAPSEAAALARIRAGGGAPMSLEIPEQGAPQSPAAAVVAAAQPQAAPDVWSPPVVAPSATPAQVQPTAPIPLTRAQGGLAPDVPQPSAVVPGQGVPVVRAAQEAAPATVKPWTMPPMPPEIGAGLPPKKRDEEISKWRLQQTAIGAAIQKSQAVQQGVERSPESIQDDAWYQILNGKARPGSVPTGRSGEGNAYKAKVADAINKISRDTGMSEQELATKGRETSSSAIALNNVTKDLSALTPFKEMLDTNANVAIELGRKIADDKTNAAIVNKPLIWLKNNATNRPDIAEYLAQIHFVEVEAARVLTQPRLVGQLTDQAIKDMKSILDGSMTLDSTERVIQRIQADGNNRINKMRDQRERTISEMRGVQPKTRTTDKATGVDTSNPLLR